MRILGRGILKGAVVIGAWWIICVTAFGAEDIRINTDLLRGVTEDLYKEKNVVVRADELFTGLDDSGFTLRELRASMRKYDADLYFSVLFEGGGFAFGRLSVSLDMNEDTVQNKQDIDNAKEIHFTNYREGKIISLYEDYEESPFYDILLKKSITVSPCMMWEDKDSDRSQRDLILFQETIELIDQVNRSGSIQQADGWRTGSTGEYFYFENGRAVTGAKTIDGAVYYFNHENCAMVQSEFINIFSDGQNRTFYFGEDGKMVTGWKQIRRDGIDCWHYFTNIGVMATGFTWIDGQIYCFEDNGTMIHDGFREIGGKRYHFNKDWADRGWQQLEENGRTGWYYFSMEDASALKGYVSSIEGDGFNYFFWTEGYVDQNGASHPVGMLAQGDGSADMWVIKDGSPFYVADNSGRLYTNTQKEWNGIRYKLDGNGVAHLMTDYSQAIEPYKITQNITGRSGNCSATSVAIVTGYLNQNTNVIEIRNNIMTNAWGSQGLIWTNLRNINGCSFDSKHRIGRNACNQLYNNGAFHKVMLKLLESGPFVIGNGEHYSVVVGYTGFDGSVLSDRDFKVYDVYDGKIHTVEDFLKYGGTPKENANGPRSTSINLCVPGTYRFNPDEYGISWSN